MRERLRLILAACFYYCGLVRLAHWWIRRSGRRLIILNYHRATGKNLRYQLEYLRRHYRILHLEEALEEFFSTEQSDKHDRRVPLVLTFDDGYLDNYTYGWQLARELCIPITIFLVPGYSESGECFWWQAPEYLVRSTKVAKVAIEGRTYTLTQPREREALVQVLGRHLRFASSVANREEFLKVAQQAFEVTLPTRASEGQRDTALPLTWAEIRAMDESKWVSFGAHTMYHPIIGYLTDVEEIRREVSESRHVLERQLGHPVRSFAYPVGKYEHIGKYGVDIVRAAGYEWAVTTIEEVNTPQTDPYLLRRLPGDVELHWLIMASELVGLLGILSRIRKKR
jgi:peptidoglycan/xylan/chitin deacetylase (PgdA/CDA1 family)